MDLKRLFYGDDPLTPARRFYTNLFYAVFVVAIFGMSVDFIPSEVTRKYGFYASISLAIITTLIIFWAILSKRLKPRQDKRTPVKNFLVLLSMPVVLPLMLCLLYWLSLVHGFPALNTKFFGHEFETIIKIEKRKNVSAKTCDYRAYSDFLNHAFPEFICIKKSFYHTGPKEEEVKLIGKQSLYGIYINKMVAALNQEPLYSQGNEDE